MYINADDLARAMSKAELVQLTNDEPRATEPNGEIVQTAIAYACDLVDGYLAGRYSLPLAQTPTILPPLCINIARHFLHARRINRADFPKTLETAYQATLKTLEQIRDGKIHIGIDTADKPRQPERGAYHVRAGAKHDWSGY
jgi:hypothetical protein